jgi:ABC-type transport system involved in cytochrome c biogenesis permease subunit
MNIMLSYGIIIGAIAMMLLFVTWRTIMDKRRAIKYKRDVYHHLASRPTLFDEQTMYNFFDAGRTAKDAARWMVMLGE